MTINNFLYLYGISMTHGKKIKLARVAADMKQAELAKLVDLQQGALSGLENGQRDITVTQLMKFAKVLNVEAKDLLPDPE
jgi:transcriptional regulator with XRE-family HTH domain